MHDWLLNKVDFHAVNMSESDFVGASSPALDARIKLIQAQADLSPKMNPQTK